MVEQSFWYIFTKNNYFENNPFLSKFIIKLSNLYYGMSFFTSPLRFWFAIIHTKSSNKCSIISFLAPSRCRFGGHLGSQWKLAINKHIKTENWDAQFFFNGSTKQKRSSSVVVIVAYGFDRRAPNDPTTLLTFNMLFYTSTW